MKQYGQVYFYARRDLTVQAGFNYRNMPKGLQGFQKGHSFYKGGEKGWFKKEQCIGKDNSNWKGGKYKRSGYWFIYQPKHPFANSTGYIRKHRLIMEKKIGRLLKKEEVVHHINGVKNDNKPENLYLMKNTGTHSNYERNLKTTYKKWKTFENK